MPEVVVVCLPEDKLEASKAVAKSKSSAEYTHVYYHDVVGLPNFVQQQPQVPKAVIISNSYSADHQESAKKAIEAGSPGVNVVLVPQGLSGEAILTYFEDLKNKAA